MRDGCHRPLDVQARRRGMRPRRFFAFPVTAPPLILPPADHLPPFAMLSAEEQVISDARRIAGEPEFSSYSPSDPREFASRIFHTCYMGTENSSLETRKRAKDLAEAVGR